MHFNFYFKRGTAIFLFLGWHLRIRRRRRSFIVHHAFIRWSCIFLRYHLETLQVDNASRSFITQWEWPHKNSEDNYKDRGFWDTNYRNISVARNYIFSLIWRCYGTKQDILDYRGTIIYILLSYYILSEDKGLLGWNNGYGKIPLEQRCHWDVSHIHKYYSTYCTR